MIAMRALATMYTNAEWVRNIFQKLGDRKRTISQSNTAAQTRDSSPTIVVGGSDAGQNRPVYRVDAPQVQTMRPQQDREEGMSTGELDWVDATGLYDVQVPPVNRAASIQGNWNQSAGTPTVTGSFGQNANPFPQTSPMDDAASSHLDFALTHCWDDLFCSDSPFNNPFILETFPGV